MSVRLIRDESGREVYRVETPCGVVGFIGADISDETLDLMIASLKRAIRRTELRLAHSLIAKHKTKSVGRSKKRTARGS